MEESSPLTIAVVVLVVFALLVGLRFWARTWKQPENTDGEAAGTGTSDPSLPRWLNILLAVVLTAVAIGFVVYRWFD